HDAVPALRRHHRGLHAGGTAADDRYLFSRGGSTQLLVLMTDIRIDRATHRMADTRAQEAALQIADTGSNFRLLPIANLVGPLGIGDHRTRDKHHVALTLIDRLIGKFARHDATAADD